jgi:hypothetical protein
MTELLAELFPTNMVLPLINIIDSYLPPINTWFNDVFPPKRKTKRMMGSKKGSVKSSKKGNKKSVGQIRGEKKPSNKQASDDDDEKNDGGTRRVIASQQRWRA